ncbi:MAG: M28 family peptidase [Chitinivibrionales bacterium]|nr:M28 family peptidase [Chitinivibrionales bacterium]
MGILRIVCILPLILITLSHSDTYLIGIQELPKELWKTMPVIEVIENTFILHATEADMQRIGQYQMNYTVFDRNPLQNRCDYFVAFPIKDEKATIAQHCRILAEYDNFFLVSVTAEQREHFFSLRIEKLVLDFHPYHFNLEIPPELRNYQSRPFQDAVKQAVALVSKDSLRSYVTKLQNFSSRKASSNSKEVTPWLEAKFRELGADSVFTQAVSNSGPNVIAIVKGQKHDPKRYCLIGAHLDGAYSGPPAAGADDNASGTAAVLEAVRVLSTMNFENTVRCAAFNSEESGIAGSKVTAAAAKSSGDKIIGGMINYDMIGYKKTTPTIFIHYDKNKAAGNEEFAKLFKETAEKYVTLTMTLTPSSGIMSLSDHSSFWSNGYVAFMAIETKERDGLCTNYHQAGDLLDNSGGLNDSELMTNTTRAAIANLATLAVPVATGVNHQPSAARLPHDFRVSADRIHRTVHIGYSISIQSPVHIAAYDLNGRQIAAIAQGTSAPGIHSIAWKPQGSIAQVIVISVKVGEERQQTIKVVMQ